MKSTVLLLPLFVLALFAFQNKGSVKTAVRETNNTEAPAGSVNKPAMLKLVNDIRKRGCQCGDTYYYPVSAVVWNDQLEAAAYAHSADMYAKNYFSHSGKDGLRGGSRLKKAGYNWKAYGENIALGYKTEKEVVAGWLKSPGHCKNIMGRNFKEMGVARVGNYWTQEFAVK